jgi:GNAT superfamily N-acetyltransferase
MKKPSRTELRIQEKLQSELCSGIKRPLFVFIEYRLFKDSEEEGSALALQLPQFLTPFSMLIHIIESHALTLLKLPCYLAKFDGEIVGVFAYQEYHESLLVASLGVRKQYRRMGMGMCLLKQMEKVARSMHKKYVEVDVLTKNVPAMRLYARSAFTFLQLDKKRLRGRKQLMEISRPHLGF